MVSTNGIWDNRSKEKINKLLLLTYPLCNDKQSLFRFLGEEMTWKGEVTHLRGQRELELCASHGAPTLELS